MVILDHEAVEEIRLRIGLSVTALWLAYVALGGTVSLGKLVNYLQGAYEIALREYDTLAVALNEALDEAGLDGAVPYADD